MEPLLDDYIVPDEIAQVPITYDTLREMLLGFLADYHEDVLNSDEEAHPDVINNFIGMWIHQHFYEELDDE